MLNFKMERNFKKVILYDLEFSDNDIMIVELPKNQEDFVFLPLKKD